MQAINLTKSFIHVCACQLPRPHNSQIRITALVGPKSKAPLCGSGVNTPGVQWGLITSMSYAVPLGGSTWY